MKYFALPLLGLFLFVALSQTGSQMSRRTRVTLTVREHWRVVPYMGYQGLSKKNPMSPSLRD